MQSNEKITLDYVLINFALNLQKIESDTKEAIHHRTVHAKKHSSVSVNDKKEKQREFLEK